MRIAIVQFPGSNCERETALAVKRAGMEPQEFLWNEPKEKLAECAGFIIVGGFSYEDRLRAGAIAALDPVMDVIATQSELGKPVLGICNGAQILVETGLVPGLVNNQVGMTLTDNKRIKNSKVLGTGYYNAWVNMRLADGYQLNAFTRCLTPKTILSVPVAHGEGRFVIPQALLMEMQTNGQNVFQYCDTTGNIIDEFPINPNGSVNNIAAVSNKAGNVMAMMPHPERTVNGDAIFQSMAEYIASGHVQRVHPLNYVPRLPTLSAYQTVKRGEELLVDLIITDNQALSVEQALQRAGFPVSVQRNTHWEITCESPVVLEKIKATGLLYNERKEKILISTGQQTQAAALLVRPKEDMVGQQKQQLLKHHFGIDGIRSIRHGIIWRLTPQRNASADLHAIINQAILFNPYAHDYYTY